MEEVTTDVNRGRGRPANSTYYPEGKKNYSNKFTPRTWEWIKANKHNIENFIWYDKPLPVEKQETYGWGNETIED